jgi:hypothetical protein
MAYDKHQPGGSIPHHIPGDEVERLMLPPLQQVRQPQQLQHHKLQQEVGVFRIKRAGNVVNAH